MAYSHLRPPTHAPLDHVSSPLDGFLPLRHHAHFAHAGAVLPVDRHECLHPVVASPRLEVPSAENPAADCPLSDHLHASPGRSWCRQQCRLLRPYSGHASRQHLHLADHRSFQSSGRYVPPSLPLNLPLRYGQCPGQQIHSLMGVYAHQTLRQRPPGLLQAFTSCIPAVEGAQAGHKLLSSQRERRR